jgi:hypothetical protein
VTLLVENASNVKASDSLCKWLSSSWRRASTGGTSTSSVRRSSGRGPPSCGSKRRAGSHIHYSLPVGGSRIHHRPNRHLVRVLSPADGALTIARVFGGQWSPTSVPSRFAWFGLGWLSGYANCRKAAMAGSAAMVNQSHRGTQRDRAERADRALMGGVASA